MSLEEESNVVSAYSNEMYRLILEFTLDIPLQQYRQ